MKISIYSILLLTGTFFTSSKSVIAQFSEKNPTFAEISAGYGASTPIIKNVSGTWTGFHFRQGRLGFSSYKSNASIKTSSLDSTGRSSSFMLDYTIPLSKFKLGNRNEQGTKGFLLQPSIGGYVQFFNFMGGKSTAFGLATELHLQLPYVLAVFRLNAGYNLSTTGIAQETSGFSMFPQLSFQFDALKGYHNGRSIFTGVKTGTTTTDTEIGRTETAIYYRRETTSWSQDWYTTVIDPFWSVSIRGGLGSEKYKSVNDYNFGIGLSGRRYLWLLDSYLSFSQYTLKGFSDVAEDNLPQNQTPFIGSAKAMGLNVNVGVDVLFTLKKLLFGQAFTDVDDGLFSEFTPLNSLYFGMGANYMVPGKANFINPTNANSELDNYFSTHPDVNRDAKTDPSNTKAGMGMNLFFQAEIGSVGIFLNASINSKIGTNRTLGVIYQFPFKKKKK